MTKNIELSDDMVTVTIAKDEHIHAGIELLKGSTITVDKETAAWMLQHHIIEG